MTEALDLVLTYAFENLRLHRIEANIQPENVDSRGSCRAYRFSNGRFFPAVSEGCRPLEGS